MIRLDHADATQQREAGGDLAEHVRQEQAWPRDAEPQGDKRQAEGGAIRHPVGGGDGACSHPAKRSQRDRIAPLQAARFLSSASTPAGDSRDQSADSLEPHPVVHASEQSESVRGVFRDAVGLTILIDLDKVLNGTLV